MKDAWMNSQAQAPEAARALPPRRRGGSAIGTRARRDFGFGPSGCAMRLAVSGLALAALLLTSSAVRADSTEDYYWSTLGGCKRFEGTESYVNRYPQGKYAEEAQACLEEWMREQQAWDAVSDCRDSAAVLQFLQEFPEGRYAQDARACVEQSGLEDDEAGDVDDRLWERLDACGDLEAISVYMDVFPQGRHAEEARACLRRLASPDEVEPAKSE